MRSDLYEIRKIGPEFHYELYSPLQCFIFFFFFFFFKKAAPAAASAGLGGGRGGAARFQPRAPSDPGSANPFSF